jgi:hypothetical protein
MQFYSSTWLITQSFIIPIINNNNNNNNKMRVIIGQMEPFQNNSVNTRTTTRKHEIKEL